MALINRLAKLPGLLFMPLEEADFKNTLSSRASDSSALKFPHKLKISSFMVVWQFSIRLVMNDVRRIKVLCSKYLI